MKASLTLRDHPKNPIFKAKIPISIFGFPFRSGIQAGDFHELCLSFSTAFCSGPLLNFCYRPNDSRRPFGFTVRTGVGSPISMTAEFSCAGRPRFLLHFKPRSGDFSVRRSVESTPAMNQNHEIQNGGVAEEKLNWSWNQFLSGAYGVLSDGEVRARTSLPVNGAVLKLGWSMKLPPTVAAEEGDGGGGGGGWRDAKLLKELPMPYLVLRKIAIEREAGEGKRREPRGNDDDVAERRLDVIREELDLVKSDNIKKEDLAHSIMEETNNNN
ncbi:hypothetical protein C2S51_022051 [Perilla frutescens var. frutescens]|nr:hypothetical protein C2S51_022051 [Perilla frutescens var. frutescens]